MNNTATLTTNKGIFGFSFLIVASFMCGEFLSEALAAIIYPPALPEIKASLRVVAVTPVEHELASVAAQYIQWCSYLLSAFTAFILVYVLAARYSPRDENAAESGSDFSEDISTGRIGESNSLTSSIKAYKDINKSTLTGQTQAIRLEKLEQQKPKNTQPKFTVAKAKKIIAKEEKSSQEIINTATHKTVKRERTIGNGRYRIMKALSSGGAGIVYKAWDTKLNRQVAAKQLFNELAKKGSHLKRFEEEAQALAALSHPNIVPIYDYVTDNGHWFVMEFLEGGDIIKRLERGIPFSINEAINICIDIASGLEAAHKKGFVHRDIKPHNILFTKDGIAKITDFGIAKTENSTVKTTAGLVLGSPRYLSPEQAAGETLDARSDIYSLGITFYEMLTGQVPFDGDTREILGKHITQSPLPPSKVKNDIPEAVDQVVLTMLSKAREDRYQTANELKEALITLLN